MSRAQLQHLALSLGVDVPFFVFGRNAFAEGIGEHLHAIHLPKRYFLIVTPQVRVPTAEIFAARELTRDTKNIRIEKFIEQRRDPRWPDNFGRNDMQWLVAKRYTEVARILGWFEKIAPARMTGSGSSVFAAFRNEHQARAAQSRLPQGVRSIVAASLDTHPLFFF